MGFEQGSGLSMLLGGVIILLVLFFFGRGLPAMMRQSEEAPKDWKGLLFPVVFLIAIIVLVASML